MYIHIKVGINKQPYFEKDLHNVHALHTSGLMLNRDYGFA